MKKTKKQVQVPARNKNEPVKPREVIPTDDLTKAIEKVLASSALNGGFETLLFKVNESLTKLDQVEETLVSHGGKINEIHNAIYHQDEGLFARIKATEVEANNHLVTLEKKLHDDDDQLDKKISLQENEIKNLEKWQNTINKIMKWIVVTLATTGTPFMVKFIYDVIVTHN